MQSGTIKPATQTLGSLFLPWLGPFCWSRWIFGSGQIGEEIRSCVVERARTMVALKMEIFAPIGLFYRDFNKYSRATTLGQENETTTREKSIWFFCRVVAYGLRCRFTMFLSWRTNLFVHFIWLALQHLTLKQVQVRVYFYKRRF